MLTAQKDTKRLKALYERSLRVRSAIPHPLIMGIIRECGGKMHLGEEQWELAYEDFFEAFKNYDESGSSKKITCLKYLVLANMLMRSTVDPFEAQESKPYRNDPQIVAMTNLVSAYQRNDAREFEKILKRNRRSIMDDPFVRGYIQELLHNVRVGVLIGLLRPYKRVRVAYLASSLGVDAAEVEALLVACVLDGVVAGKIDQINGLFVRDEDEAAVESAHAKAAAASASTKAAAAGGGGGGGGDNAGSGGGGVDTAATAAAAAAAKAMDGAGKYAALLSWTQQLDAIHRSVAGRSV